MTPKPKALPHSEEVEKRILGTILLDNTAVWQILDRVATTDFYILPHRYIYGAFIELVELGEEINAVTVSEILSRDGRDSDVVQVGKVITDLAKGIPKDTDLSFYVESLLQHSIARQKIKLNELISQSLLNGDYRSAEAAEAQLAKLSEESVNHGLTGMQSFADEVLFTTFEHGKNPSSITGIRSGIKKFDYYTAGLQRSDLIIVAARPSVGKTALCLNIAQFASLVEQSTVAVFSLEMSKEQLYTRLLAQTARVELQKIRTGNLSKEEWKRIIYGKKKLDTGKIFIDDTAGRTPLQVKAACKKLKQSLGLDLVIIDYLQLMSPSQRAENRQQETSQISRELKQLAKELSVPVIVLSQLNRAPEARKNNRPQLSDLRDSGAIEQDADIVAFLFREEMHQKTDDNENMAELIIAKQRNGATGTIPLCYIKEFTKFENIFEVA